MRNFIVCVRIRAEWNVEKYARWDKMMNNVSSDGWMLSNGISFGGIANKNRQRYSGKLAHFRDTAKQL